MNIKKMLCQATLAPMIALAALAFVFMFGATYYVDPNGSDDANLTQAQNPNTPWKTVQHAADACPNGLTVNYIRLSAATFVGGVQFGAAHNAKKIAFSSTDPNHPATINNSGGNYAVYVDGTYAPTVGRYVSFDDILFDGNVPYYLVRLDDPNGDVRFTNCTLGSATQAKTIILLTDGIGPGKLVLSLSHCNLRQDPAAVAEFLTAVSDGTDSMDSLSIADCNLTLGNRGVIRMGKDGRLFEFLRNTVDANAMDPNGYVPLMNQTAAAGTCNWGLRRIAGNTFNTNSAAMAIPKGSGSVIVEDNVINVVAAQATSGIVGIGTDGFPPSDPNMGPIIVQRNRVSFVNGPWSHGILIGSGLTGVLVANNAIRNADYGIVCKSSDALLINNVIYYDCNSDPGLGYPVGFMLRSCCKTKLWGNTVYFSRHGCAIYADTQSGGDAPYNNIAERNVFVSKAGNDAPSFLLDSGGTGGFATMRWDYNVYNAGDTLLAAVNTTELADLAAWQAFWNTAANSTVTYGNDAHSTEADACLVSPITGNFRPRSWSPAIDNDPNYPWFDQEAGAWERMAQPGRGGRITY